MREFERIGLFKRYRECGAPPASFGQDGDDWIDLMNGMYYVKELGSWAEGNRSTGQPLRPKIANPEQVALEELRSRLTEEDYKKARNVMANKSYRARNAGKIRASCQARYRLKKELKQLETKEATCPTK